MIASLLSPASAQPQQPRISQLLPSVKCSTCHQPVPLSELGEHTCTAPPPVPGLPKPAITPEAATALLPGRLQGRLQGRGGGSPNAPAPVAIPQRGQDHQRAPSSASTISRLNVNTTRTGGGGGVSPTQGSIQQKSSPLTDSPRMGEAPFPPSSSQQSSFRDRMRTPSNAGSISSQNTPATARPLGSFSSSQEGHGRSGSGFPSAPLRSAPPPSFGGQPQRMGSPALSGNAYPSSNNRGPPSNYNNNNAVPPPPASAGSNISFPSRPPPGAPPTSAPGIPPVNNNNLPPESFVPPSERGIDTKTGGEAGMAGVGRRGFAAAARAAMFVSPHERPGGPQSQSQYGQRRPPNAPHFLDIDAVSRSASTSTPPLSTGSGHSSSSPGPTSPIPQVDPRYPSSQLLSNNNNNTNNNLGPKQQLLQSRTPSPFDSPTTATPTQEFQSQNKSNMMPVIDTNTTTIPTTTPGVAASPISGRLPFFDKLRLGGRLPGLEAPPPSDTLPPIPVKSDNNSNILASSSGRSIPSRSNSNSTTMSLSRSQSNPRRVDREPLSPTDSDSDYGGLAYADSTDDEGDTKTNDDDEFNSRRSNSVRKQLPPPPGSTPTPLAAAPAIFERSSRHMQFGSVSARSRSRSRSRSNDRGDIRIGGMGPMTNSVVSGHSRDESISSYSSEGGYGEGDGRRRTRERTNSEAVALALGLSKAAGAEYSKLGGPGMVMRSESRSRSQSRSRTGESGGDQEKVIGGGGALALDRSQSGSTSSSAVGRRLYGGSSIDSGSTRGGGAQSVTSSSSMRLRKLDMAAANNLYDNANANDDNEAGTAMHRSRTVQGTQSPEAAKKAIKLPMRSLTSPSPKISSDKALVEAGGATTVKKTKTRVRSCLRCAKTIDDGRWVSVDGGGVLCERCWKNMYLPKCRRCNLVIERAAVSSSDGQLKGKYHKECFNCHTCHKPFPDKSFYVYDGKPLCAYHYHEANDSLCAAALCGQPIEGPCAVSHTGDRYHPEHMTCEYPGYPECMERLKDYWEVDGRMLCERHAHYATRSGSGSGEEGEEEWVQTTRAKKRVTRFIDLAGAGGLGGSGAVSGAGRDEKEDSGLR